MKMLVQMVTWGSNVRYIGTTERTFHAGYWLITWDRGADKGARYHATNDQTFIAAIESHLVQWEPLGKPYIAEIASLPWDKNGWFSNILRDAEWSGYVAHAARAATSGRYVTTVEDRKLPEPPAGNGGGSNGGEE